jgi:hypothetical protein
VIYQNSPTTLPYARPKVGRRASDRQLLDDWYARHAEASDRAADVRPVPALRAHPAARPSESASGPSGGHDRRVTHAAAPAIG